MLDAKEHAERGYTRPRAAHQSNGGRAAANWDSHIIGDLKRGLEAPDFLNALAKVGLKPGNRLHIAAFADAAALREERLSEVCEVMIISVVLPETPKAEGRVEFAQLAYYDIAAAQRLHEAKRLAGAA